MSVYKPFITSDVVTSPFKVNKSFSFKGVTYITSSFTQSGEITEAGIDRFIGYSTPPTGSPFYGSTPTGDIAKYNQYLVYRSIRELYYYNYLKDEDGSPAGTASFNPDGTITGPLYTPNAYNYLTNTLPAGRYFPTGSEQAIGVLSIPSNLFGEYIKPSTFVLELGPVAGEPRIIVTDDGEGNLIYDGNKVGDIIYPHGIAIITNDGIGPLPGNSGYGWVIYGSTNYGDSDAEFVTDFINATDITCSFQSTVTLYETQYKCTIRENEYNFSQNNTLISGSSNTGVLSDFATGSYFTPYITTVGLYNNNKELLAVAKLAQPLRVSDTTDTSIIINLDL